jgi:VIT1/CCC1 family predicted Fe2+/Mn2+ transporter
VDGVHLYTALSQSEKNPQLARVYAKMAESEEKHCRFWEKKLRDAGVHLPGRKPSLRSWTLSLLSKCFGPRFVLPTVSMLEKADLSSYDSQPEARDTNLPTDERSHARLIAAISQSGKTGMTGGAVAGLEGRHRAIGGNALRAAVLGANDGLVSNLSLIMGVAGASFSANTILITGFAGLLAGSCSMAMGEWLSVQSSRELYLRQIEVERDELKEAPHEEAEELALIYEAKGLSKTEAQKLAQSLIKNPEKALDALTREELGIDPETLGGSAWVAAIMSFVLFCIGAAIPLMPFLFLKGAAAIPASLIASAAGLFLIGAMITLLTGRGVLFSGARQLAIGLGSAAVTYLIGRLIGVAMTG